MNKNSKLNKEQKAAVNHGTGPLLIIAGAGTGKTTVVTERIKRLILDGHAKASEILALTFTEKASREMEERVDVAMPYGVTQMWISTFHKFCDRILRSEALHIGLDPKFKLMTEAETIALLRRYLFKFDLKYFRPLGNPNKFLDGMLQHFSRLQDENIAPTEYIAWAKKFKGEKIEKEKWQELASAYQKYEEIKIAEAVLDYGDLIVKTLDLFSQRPNILAAYQKQFKYILVDEFQDTNFAQNELVTLLASKHKNITVVGDDDQSIYKFRGAAISNILQFRKNFPKTKVVVLTQNYRSYQTILDGAYSLITHNNPDRLEAVENINKKLKSTKRGDGIVSFIHKDRAENEADAVARKIKELIKSEKYNYRDFAVLVRANNHADAFLKSFQRNGIVYQFLGPGRLFKQSEIIDLISYLKILYNFEDSLSLTRVLSLLDIPVRDVIRLTNAAKKLQIPLFEICEHLGEIEIASKSKQTIEKFCSVVSSHIEDSRKKPAALLLYDFLEKMDLLPSMLSPDTPDAEKRAKNVAKFFDKLKTFEIEHEDATVMPVVDWIELVSELGESPAATDTDWTEIDAVNILTVHSSKGLEFPVVFLVNLVSERFPTRERREQIPIPDDLIRETLPRGDFHIQEERRLFYVGMTRACDALYLTAANYYGEAKREKKLSPFIFEALGDNAKSAEEAKEQGEQLSLLDFAPKESSISKPEELHIDYLSYSQIETFQVCPLHYYLRYIIKIPSETASAQSFGISMHAALKNFYDRVKTGEAPSEKLILQTLKENWETQGYKGKEHEREAFRKAKGFIKEYFKNQFSPKKLPVVMEQPFVIDITKNLPADRQGQKPLKIGGTIDRVDKLSGGKIEIIDYKTGATVPTQKEVDKNLQLTFYALAATRILEEPFNKKPEEIILSLYYFETGQKISTTRTKSQLDNDINEIYKIRKEIEGSDFECSKGFLCENCEYKLFCHTES